MATISGHDRRQLARVAERLEMFEHGQLSLQVLVADLEFLLSALESRDTRDELRSKWEVLEEVYSAAVAMNRGPDEQGDRLVREAVGALRKRIGELAN